MKTNIKATVTFKAGAPKPHWVRITENGNRTSHGWYATKEEADAAAAIINGAPIKASSIKATYLREAIPIFLQWVEKHPSFQPNSEKAHLEVLVKAPTLAAALNTWELRNLDCALVWACDQKMKKTGEKPSWFHLNNMRTTLVRLGQWLYMEAQVWKENHALKVQSPRKKTAEEKEPQPCITRESYIRIVNSPLLSIEERNTVLFSLYTGMRESEQWALTPESFTTEGKITYMQTTLAKTKALHKVAIIGPAVGVLKSQLGILTARADESGLLFPSRSGVKRKGTPKDLTFVLKLCEARDGGPSKSLHWHSLRNSFATAIQEGWFGHAVSEKDAQLLIGHTNPQQTRAYSRAQLVNVHPGLFETSEASSKAAKGKRSKASTDAPALALVTASPAPERAPTRRARRQGKAAAGVPQVAA